MASRRLSLLLAVVGLVLAHGTVASAAPAKVTALAELRVNEVVDGDVVALGGDVVLGPAALVRGHAVAVFGTVRAEPGARVEGRMISLASLAGVATTDAAERDPRVRTGLRLLTAGGWLLATTLLAWLWPGRVRYGVVLLPQLGLLRIGALGVMVALTLLAALIAAVGLGPMAGLPLAAILGMAFLAVKTVGLTVLGGAIGSRLLGRLAAGRALPLTAAVFVGVLVMLMVRFLPVVGGAVWTLLAVAALGAGVFAVTMAPHHSAAELVDSQRASDR